MQVPYTVIVLEAHEEGPDWFKETARVVTLPTDEEAAIKEAVRQFNSESPTAKVVGILKGSHAPSWVPASKARG